MANISLLFFTLMITSLSLSSYLIISVSSGQIFTPLDNIALNCGYYGDSVDLNNRTWTGDVSSKYLSSQQQQLNSSSISVASTQDFAQQIPYMTARVFRSQFTYSFNVTTLGPIFVRLYFHPTSYSNTSQDISQSYFNVTLNNFTVLRNFSTLLAARDLDTTYFVKEFYVNMVSELLLNITFSPSPDSFAFINGIEIVSVPADLYTDGTKNFIMIVGQPQTYLIIDSSTAFEMVYRLNVGASLISPDADTGMFRNWSKDDDYISGAATGEEPYNLAVNISYTKVPPYTAPETLYRTARSMGMIREFNEKYNLTWRFPVDSGYYYLVRLHFCEIAPEITGLNYRVFQIFLNSQTAEDHMDIMVFADRERIGVPIYRDFIVSVPGNGSKSDLWLALHPNTNAHTAYSDALLNGLEIFKLNKSDGSLAGLNPVSTIKQEHPNRTRVFTIKQEHPKKTRIVFIITGVVVLGGAVALAVSIFFMKNSRCFRMILSWKRSRKNDQNFEIFIRQHGSLAPKRYSYSDIKKMTNSLKDKLGQGGYGCVYKGKLLDGRLVAVKILNESKGNGEEFINEVASISRTSHVNIVTILGYCFDGKKRGLIYEFMPNGSLEKFIYGGHPSILVDRKLGWEKLYQIAIGIARGLEYLHRGCNTRIVHFDIKPHNILLDEDFCPKIADFGLAKLCPRKESIISMMGARGTIGYIAPEVYNRNFGGVSHKSDVYSYGSMILEMVGGRKNIEVGVSQTSEIYFPHWIYKRLELDNEFILEGVMTEVENDIARKMVIVGLWCIQTNPSQRPSINKVIDMLEGSIEALQIPPKPFLSSPPRSPENPSTPSTASVL